MSDPLLLAPFRAFAESLTANFKVSEFNPAQAEDQLKGPTQTLLKQAGEAFSLKVEPRTEAQTSFGVRPDLGVSVGVLLTGHVELKAPGKGARAKAFSDAHDKEQFKRFRDHPNLLYTDGNEWALHRGGEISGKVVRAAGDVRSDGAGTFSADDARELETLLRSFLFWEPLAPTSPRALADLLAPLTRLLREEVRAALTQPGSALASLADEWRDYFFPDADDFQFADAYAQTVTYALLLARVEGETNLRFHASDRLDARHGLLAQVLRVLAETGARREVEAPIELLERSIAAVAPEDLSKRAKNKDLWLYFYEDFLAAYDPKLRKQRGVYFTPAQVVQAQTTLVSELLTNAFEKPLGFADDDVTVLDPAVGTGTYLLAAMQAGLDRVREQFGEGNVAGRASIVAESFHGFELLIGSYAVAHLRFAQQLLTAGATLPEDGVQIYLTDTLESPHAAPPGYAHTPLFQKKLAEENERARRVKTDTRVLVCIGNPPYFRQVIGSEEVGVERQGGWIRGTKNEDDAPLRDFLRDAPGVHAKNLYNLYVYFWRWALWKVFENSPGRGVVSFITASSYLRGPGFAGMRRFMRETFDDLWIVDLGGDNLGARKSENVFDIQTPVAIAVGIRHGGPNPSLPAAIRYARIEGTQAEKLATLAAVQDFGSIAWQDCFTGWHEPFLPKGQGDYYSWPALTDLWPWQHSGVQFKRTWPIAAQRETLSERWQTLVGAPPEARASLFRETRDRKITRSYRSLTEEKTLERLDQLPREAPPPGSTPYAYRSFDRHYCLADSRLGDFLRPALWKAGGARQLYMTSLLTNVLGEGPAVTVADRIPDLHHFRGSFGGKDIVPLWRDHAATEPNLPAGLLGALNAELATTAEPEDLFAYCYAVLSAPSYTETFAEELAIPGPRVPITREADTFGRGVRLGKELIWLHTYGQRFIPDGHRAGEVPQGAARCTKAVPPTEDGYPTRHDYDEAGGRLLVGEGVFEPVSKEVREFSVSGLDVLGSWLGYRMKEGAGRRSSPLDEIRPATWPAAFTEELLRLLWILERTVELGSELDRLLADVVAGLLLRAVELPEPTDAERAPPS